MREEPLYWVGTAILQRCNNPKNPWFKNYGGRGIKCLLGKTSKEVYLELLKIKGYKKGLQLDRINNDGNYEHGNLRWVTSSENNFNCRRSKDISYYEKVPIRRCNFKVLCKRRGINFEDFEETPSGEYYFKENEKNYTKDMKNFYKKRSDLNEF